MKDREPRIRQPSSTRNTLRSKGVVHPPHRFEGKGRAVFVAIVASLLVAGVYLHYCSSVPDADLAVSKQGSLPICATVINRTPAETGSPGVAGALRSGNREKRDRSGHSQHLTATRGARSGVPTQGPIPQTREGPSAPNLARTLPRQDLPGGDRQDPQASHSAPDATDRTEQALAGQSTTNASPTSRPENPQDHAERRAERETVLSPPQRRAVAKPAAVGTGVSAKLRAKIDHLIGRLSQTGSIGADFAQEERGAAADLSAAQQALTRAMLLRQTVRTDTSVPEAERARRDAVLELVCRRLAAQVSACEDAKRLFAQMERWRRELRLKLDVERDGAGSAEHDS